MSLRDIHQTTQFSLHMPMIKTSSAVIPERFGPFPCFGLGQPSKSTNKVWQPQIGMPTNKYSDYMLAKINRMATIAYPNILAMFLLYTNKLQ